MRQEKGFIDWTKMSNDELVEEVVQAISLKFNSIQLKFKHTVWKQWLDLYWDLKKIISTICNFGQSSSEMLGKMST